MTNPRLRVGSVPYLNARPLVEGLAADPDIEYSESIPSRLAIELEQDRVDVALVSSVVQLKLPDALRIGDYGIVSVGPVWSVLLVGEADPLAARTVALDGASLTAATLTRIVYGTLLGRSDVQFHRTVAAPELAGSANATLIIGDAALQPIPKGLQAVDLGEVWTQHTGLPFVWASWLARPQRATASAAAVLDAAARRGLALRDSHAEDARRFGVDPTRARGYLRDAIRFPIGEPEERGLRQFLEWAGPHIAALNP